MNNTRSAALGSSQFLHGAVALGANRTTPRRLARVDQVCESGNMIHLGPSDSPILDLGPGLEVPRSLNATVPGVRIGARPLTHRRRRARRALDARLRKSERGTLGVEFAWVPAPRMA